MSLLPTRPDAEPAEDAGPRVIGVDDDEADDVLAALSSGTARRLLAALHDEPAAPSELAERVDTSLQNVQYHLGKLEAAGAVEVVDTAYSAKGREMDLYAPADRPLVVFAGDEERGATLKTALGRLLGAVGLLAFGSLVVQALYGDGPTISFGLGAPGGGADGGQPPAGDGGDTDLEAADAAQTATPTARSAPDATATPEGTATPTGDPSIMQTETEATTETAMETATEAARTATEGYQATETPARTVADTVETVEAVGTVTREGAGGLPPGLVFFAGGLFVVAAVAGVWYLGARRSR